jgi:NADPH:quinone reductase-like Zn-dependent oxidoreductase
MGVTADCNHRHSSPKRKAARRMVENACSRYLSAMKAVRMHSFGGPDVLTLEELPKPTPGPHEVLIRVEAAGVNPVDCKTRSGEFKPAGLQLPLTLGLDISGVVEEVGRDVFGQKVGNEVYAMLGPGHGAYAEYVAANYDSIVPKPANLDHLHAAAVPLAASTAWQGLFDHGKLKAGERVLIHGAAGGVGHFAVQFAKDRGACVIATGRAEDRDLLRKWGADEVIDYTRERFEDRARDIDLVFDLVAGETQQRSWNVLKEGGRIISTLQPPSLTEAALHHAKGEAFMVESNRDELAQIGRMIDEGRVSVFLQQAFPITEARRAHDHMEHEHVRGKVVLAVNPKLPVDKGPH